MRDTEPTHISWVSKAAPSAGTAQGHAWLASCSLLKRRGHCGPELTCAPSARTWNGRVFLGTVLLLVKKGEGEVSENTY